MVILLYVGNVYRMHSEPNADRGREQIFYYYLEIVELSVYLKGRGGNSYNSFTIICVNVLQS